MTKFYAFCRCLVGWFFKLFFSTKVFGPKKLEQKKTLLAANHMSLIDPVIVGCNLKPQLYFWGKKELFDKKLIGWFLRKLGVTPINRGEPDIASVKAALTILKNEKIFALFPEGTRNKNDSIDEKMLDLKNGLALLAIKSQAPIRLAIIYKKPKFLRKNYLYIDDEFTLDEFFGKKISADVLADASKFIQSKFDQAASKLSVMVNELKKK